MTNTKHKPLVLIILDGWGHSEKHDHNAIHNANIPLWDTLLSKYPHTLLEASGLEVGLPEGQMGNSEVGHLNIGSGRVVFQDLPRIDNAIANGEFFENPTFLTTMRELARAGKALHLLGLVSPGGVHSHETHLLALLQLAKKEGLKKVYIHAFLDGRDTPPRSALPSLEKIAAECSALECGRITSVAGRYYAMDRDKRWERTQLTYDMLTSKQAPFHSGDAISALKAAYERGENDEFVQPTLIDPAVGIEDGDSILFFNFRSDRARQLSRAFLHKDFPHFTRKFIPQLSHFISMTQYAEDIPSEIAFAPQQLKQILGEYLSQQGLQQFRIAETEKYAHVTFFFNGGIERPFPGEDRLLISSPPVATYDLQPEMSAHELTTQLVAAIQSQKYDFIVCNYANPDMVGHTGSYSATIEAVQTIDHCLKEVYQNLQQVGGEMIITADHGNAECMYDPETQQPHTAHTNEPVPFVYVGREATIRKKNGILADVAPTILHIMGLKQPKEMTGESLVTIK